MVGKTGAARVALETGAPVIPVAQWGPQEMLAPYAKRPRFFPRKTHARRGPARPSTCDDLRDRAVDAALLHEVTERIMAAITALLEEIRGEQAPPSASTRRQQGCPRPATRGVPRRPGERRPA